ncbi:hypothetical protein [Haloplasma contractile]|uniref:TIR domain-containing protein n=1 Tax=Haloplasma contractile SSD-17B TaxID=1033810 RepID=F7Q1U9_9MOLU|nr:hypothetical protein [Haloplasma contractile]ERJ12240.1 hypothetical protein HLPCO_001767 [Haloplasma contractile SSD-17B]
MQKVHDLTEITITEVEMILNRYNLNNDNIEHLFDLIYIKVIMKYDDSFIKEHPTKKYNMDLIDSKYIKHIIDQIDYVYWNVDHVDLRVENFYKYRDFSYMNQTNYENIMAIFKDKYKGNELWDIFLSHSFTDRIKVYGVYLLLTLKYKLKVYVDWIVDRNLNRSSVTKKNVRTLQLRMNQCKSLLVVKTRNYKTSVWVPWEVGYFNGSKNSVAIIGVKGKKELNYQGVEYYSLYSLVLYEKNSDLLYVCKGTLHKIEDLIPFNEWCNKDDGSKVVNY